VPILLGSGRRLFDDLDGERFELERTRTLEGECGVTHVLPRPALTSNARPWR